ncbi:L-seryl-tRNA(Sec) selenium transferase [Micrococcoides hystricis]|uniref:L-seryl-tRNA(Sec) selenium transferase n=1 Tax=Micrococcoides hystricis TaxID=1572761 RepID=A0ABV6PD05_9MICC
MAQDDFRRAIPRTDALLAEPAVAEASAALGHTVVRGVIRQIQDQARRGDIAPTKVLDHVIAALNTTRSSSLTPVLNGTGVLIHTNLGRAPLSKAAQSAVSDAAGYVDLEMDLDTGVRSRRATALRQALLEAVPAAQDALVVNNCAAALLLVSTALGANGPMVISRGELIEIGAGFRLPELMGSAGTELVEIGATNRTHLADYAAALQEPVGAVLKMHPSNYVVRGFTAEVSTTELAKLCAEKQVPLVVDIGSGLLAPEPLLPNEPDFSTALADGADLVLASGDKLLGGPQAGIILGCKELIGHLARHPIARAVRADKLTIAALEATVRAGTSPIKEALHTDLDALRSRTEKLGAALNVPVVEHDGRVGGGGGVEVPLPGVALKLPEALAQPLRTGTPAILTRVKDGACLLDLRCIEEEYDEQICAILSDALNQLD